MSTYDQSKGVVMNFTNSSPRAGSDVSQFTFGRLTIKCKGLGVFIPGKKFADRFAEFSVDELRAMNREAWKQRKAAERTANRYNNVTLHGWSTYESAALHEAIATAVCSASWAALKQEPRHD
jgi:hypothetical protein